MGKRQRIEPREPEGWEVHPDYRAEGLARLTPGVEVSVKGLGRCRYLRTVEAPAGTWVDLYWPRNGGIRSVTLDRLRTVHRSRKLKTKGGK